MRRTGALTPRRAGLTVARFAARNPFLVLALVALILRYGLPLLLRQFGAGVMGVVWTGAVYALRPLMLVATWIDPYLRRFPDWVDLVGTLALGLLPYIALDAAYRRLILYHVEERPLMSSPEAFESVTRTEAQSLEIPVLMISGGRSYPLFQLVDAELERYLANVRRVVVPDGTHDVCSEQPQTCAAALRAFVTGHGSVLP